MLIGELSRKTNVSVDTIRYYEKIGLIDKGNLKRKSNNYKEYSTLDAEAIQLVKQLQSFGMSLTTINDVLSGWRKGENSCNGLSAALKDKLPELKRTLELIQTTITQIEGALSRCSGDCEFESTSPSCLNASCN